MFRCVGVSFLFSPVGFRSLMDPVSMDYVLVRCAPFSGMFVVCECVDGI